MVAKARPLGRVDGEAGSKKPSLETLGEAQRGQEWTEACVRERMVVGCAGGE